LLTLSSSQFDPKQTWRLTERLELLALRQASVSKVTVQRAAWAFTDFSPLLALLETNLLFPDFRHIKLSPN
jgi:hypothetical protein